MLYVFGGAPRCGLNAGGLQHACEEVAQLCELEHDPHVQYVRSGVYVVTSPTQGERLGTTEHHLSNLLDRHGIDWDWFQPEWGFGNGITIHHVTAVRETQVVDLESGAAIKDLVALGKPVDLGKVRIQLVHKSTEGWENYSKRWRPGMCPQETHQVWFTWLAVKGQLDPLAYSYLQRLIEDPAATLEKPELYREQHFSATRSWSRQPPSPELLRLLA